MLKTVEEIKEWLDRYGIVRYIINKDLTVDVDSNVDLSYPFKKYIIKDDSTVIDDDTYLLNEKLKSIDVQFNKVNGSFYCNNNKLTSLKGCPKVVNVYFSCTGNPNLSSLEYLPIVKGYLICDYKFKNDIEYKQWKLLKALRK